MILLLHFFDSRHLYKKLHYTVDSLECLMYTEIKSRENSKQCVVVVVVVSQTIGVYSECLSQA